MEKVSQFMKLLVLSVITLAGATAWAGEAQVAAQFRKEVQPILKQYCYDCHADGENKGGVAFDELKSNPALRNHELWLKVMKNLRANLMPPQKKKSRPSVEERRRVENWIKYRAFGIDPQNPDPGRVTVRRLNRVEYKNTIRDLLDVKFETEEEFPVDDTGYGFDNIGDVLTLSPMLLEKYLDAAKTIVAQAVPTMGAVMPEKIIQGWSFRSTNAAREKSGGRETMPYKEAAVITNTCKIEQAGRYQLVLDFNAYEKYVDDKFDYNKCRLIFRADGQQLLDQEFVREGGKAFHFEYDRDWQPGEHELAFELQPLTPNEPSVRSLNIFIRTITVRGPPDEKFWVKPQDHERFFPKDVPASPAERRAYARELLGGFATKAFRRPVDEETADRLATLAEGVYTQPRQTFEAGVAHAMVAVLASPRFLFREEAAEANPRNKSNPFIDEYALASRLSYFLWASMPDDELFRLAGAGQLRADLPAQIKRMLADKRAKALMENFTGQWLQARDIENVPIDARAVLAREEKPDPEREQKRKRMKELSSKKDDKITPAEKEEFGKLQEFFAKNPKPVRVELNDDLRRAMRREVEAYFSYIVREDRSVIELIESDYTFLNEKLAKHYGITNVTGTEPFKVMLPPDSPRGGVLTMAGVLAVTSNPTRTSPVKRGLFILENILGNPAPPPPPDIPPLEDSEKDFTNGPPTLREVLALHREKPLCASCHNRMDPPGLALENFNALGLWRDREHDQPVDAAGKLITGETFSDIRELKHILATRHRAEFYRTLTEKMLTFALGRGLEYYDTETVDQIVSRLEKEDGRFSALLMGVIESSPFQKRREGAKVVEARPSQPVPQLAGARLSQPQQHREE